MSAPVAPGLRVSPLVIVAALTVALLPRASDSSEVHHRGEVSLAAGLYRTTAGQDLGVFEQLGNLRRGILAASWGAMDLRGAYCPVERICLGGVVSLLSGPLDGRVALALGYRVELTGNLLRGRFTPFAALTAGGISIVSAVDLLGRDTDPAAGWSAGLKLRVGSVWQLRAQVTHLLTDAQEEGAVAHNLAFTAGVGYRFSAVFRGPRPPSLDEDGDGIPLAADRCPAQAEDPDGFRDGDGCPDEDDDGDGVADLVDLCPRHAGAAPRGCPPGQEVAGADGEEAH